MDLNELGDECVPMLQAKFLLLHLNPFEIEACDTSCISKHGVLLCVVQSNTWWGSLPEACMTQQDTLLSTENFLDSNCTKIHGCFVDCYCLVSMKKTEGVLLTATPM
jgi:hypothetical protein